MKTWLTLTSFYKLKFVRKTVLIKLYSLYNIWRLEVFFWKSFWYKVEEDGCNPAKDRHISHFCVWRYNLILCFASDATMDDGNSRQMQAFNTIQSQGSLGECKQWMLNQDSGEGGPGFLTPDAITLLGLLTLAVLLIRQDSHKRAHTSSKKVIRS